jgi:hypothetical protein
MTGKTATVRVRLVVEVDANGVWGEDATMSQIRSQGTEAAVNGLTRVITEGQRAGNPAVRILEVAAVNMVVRLEGK